MSLTRMNEFTQTFSAIVGDYISKDSVNIKAFLDSQPKELRDYIINTLIPEIEAQYSTKQEINNVVLGQVPNDSLGEVKMAADMKKNIGGGIVGYDKYVTELVDKAKQTDVDAINIKLTDYNSYASSADSNGIYTVVDYKRADGTLYMKSTLSGGTSPNYTTDTWKFYDTAGTTVILTKTWTITYDANGKITSKVVA